MPTIKDVRARAALLPEGYELSVYSPGDGTRYAIVERLPGTGRRHVCGYVVGAGAALDMIEAFLAGYEAAKRED